MRNLMKDQPAIKKKRGLVLTVSEGYDTLNQNKNAHANT
jgi:hypothetical protein